MKYWEKKKYKNNLLLSFSLLILTLQFHFGSGSVHHPQMLLLLHKQECVCNQTVQKTLDGSKNTHQNTTRC